MNISEINYYLDKGYIPDCLFYSTQKDRINIDPQKITYNDYYQSYDFYETKFDADYSSIPGFDKVIQTIADNAKRTNNTPLKEIEERLIFDDDNNKISSNR